jgi:hypothetical protein
VSKPSVYYSVHLNLFLSSQNKSLSQSFSDNNVNNTFLSVTTHKIVKKQSTYDVTLRRVLELLLPYYIFVCVCACVWVPGRVGMCMRVRTCGLAYPAYNSYAPYFEVICGSSGSTIFFDII